MRIRESVLQMLTKNEIMRRQLLVILLALSLPLGASAKGPNKQPMPAKKFAISKENIRDLVRSRAASYAPDTIMVEGKKVGYMYREAAEYAEDSGWRFFAGDERQAYVDDVSHFGIYSVNTVANYDPDIIPYLETPAPCAFETIVGTNKYRPVSR